MIRTIKGAALAALVLISSCAAALSQALPFPGPGGRTAFCQVSTTNASVLWHFDGNFNDSSGNGYTGTASGSAAASGTAKFGTFSASLPSAGSSKVQGAGTISLGSGNWTMDFWINPTSLPGSGVGPAAIGIDSNGITWRAGAGGTPGDTYTYWAVGAPYTPGGASVVSTGSWQHIAIVRSGGNLYWFINGTQVNGSPRAIAASAAASLSLAIGNNSSNQWGFYDGLIDEMRVLVGTAYWTSNFTPPILPWCN